MSPKSLLIAVLAIAVLPGAVRAQDTNAAWAQHITAQLKLNPTQEASLRAFTAASDQVSKVTGPSEDQMRAMTLVERMDLYATRSAIFQGQAQAGAAALHRFYSLLSPDQKTAFDDATRRRDYHPSVAADVVGASAPTAPDYRLPAHVSADWLIKPTAENISRVYPEEALRRRLAGHATIHCTVDEDGYLANCVVKEETPGNLGFGNAALEMTGYMRMQPATNYGLPVRSDVSVPITFTYPADE